MPVSNLGRIGFVTKGDWEAGNYKYLDVVKHVAATWICAVPTTTEEPGAGTDWQNALTAPAVTGIAEWSQLTGTQSPPLIVYDDQEYWSLIATVSDIAANKPSESPDVFKGNGLIDDAATSNLTTWSSEKISGDIDTKVDTLQSNLVQKSPSILVVDQLRRSVEAASGGRVTVFYTAKGQPSYFHVLPKFLCEDIAPGGELGTGVFPAFLNGGVEESQIYIGQFQMSDVDGEGVSQPQREVRRSIDWDSSRSLIQACGAGFDMMTVWDWAALHFWTQRTGFEPRGNTNRGRHHDERHETGIRVDGGSPGASDGTTNGNTLSGSGPMSWRHDGTPAGVSDTVGNIGEWLLGMKLMDGRVMLAADNGIGSESSWQDTGYDMPALSETNFNSIDNAGVPEAVLRAMLIPTGAHPMSGSAWSNLGGERLPRRGGNRANGASAGPAALSLSGARELSATFIGSRPRFRPQ